MTLEILQGGQTGVDRGAALAALDLGVPIGGYMPADGCDEDGPIPDAIAMHMRRHDRTNPAARTRANVALADAVLVIVADRRRAGATRGTALTIGLCEARCRRDGRGHFSLLVVDPPWHEAGIIAWGRLLLKGWREDGPRRALRLLVAGPRASLWADGEQEARRFVGAICEVARG